MAHTRSSIPTLLLAAALVVALYWFWPSPKPDAAPREAPHPTVDTVNLRPTLLEGNPQATVGLVMFADFECPFCARFVRDTLPALRRQYIETGQVLLAFRHLPLPSLHPEAVPAAEAAECAADRGRFWPVAEALFTRPTSTPPAPRDYAQFVGVPVADLDECRARVRDVVAEDAMFARGHGIVSTPTFFPGRLDGRATVTVTETLMGAKPLAEFEAAISRVRSAGGR